MVPGAYMANHQAIFKYRDHMSKSSLLSYINRPHEQKFTLKLHQQQNYYRCNMQLLMMKLTGLAPKQGHQFGICFILYTDCKLWHTPRLVGSEKSKSTILWWSLDR